MRAQSGVLAELNKVLAGQLVAINQYFLHARMYKNEGFEGLNQKCYKQSILKMKQADWVIERILLLEGLPNLQDLGSLRIGETCEERLQCDMAFELLDIDLLRRTIAFCEQAGDYISRDLLAKIMGNEEDQVDWIESQQYIVKHSGIENYLQAMMNS